MPLLNASRSHQDESGGGRDEVEERRATAEQRLGELADHRILHEVGADRVAVRQPQLVQVVGVDVPQVHQLGQHDDADQHADGDPTEQRQRGGRILALRPLEGRHSVADRLHAGQRRAAGGERP
jgi:hypothetical protein